jgi:hypothetical protein
MLADEERSVLTRTFTQFNNIVIPWVKFVRFNMIIDAMDLLYSIKIDGFCIVSIDSDFYQIM